MSRVNEVIFPHHSNTGYLISGFGVIQVPCIEGVLGADLDGVFAEEAIKLFKEDVGGRDLEIIAGIQDRHAPLGVLEGQVDRRAPLVSHEDPAHFF